MHKKRWRRRRRCQAACLCVSVCGLRVECVRHSTLAGRPEWLASAKKRLGACRLLVAPERRPFESIYIRHTTVLACDAAHKTRNQLWLDSFAVEAAAALQLAVAFRLARASNFAAQLANGFCCCFVFVQRPARAVASVGCVALLCCVVLCAVLHSASQVTAHSQLASACGAAVAVGVARLFRTHT